MGARGIYTAQEEHVVNLLPPKDINGGFTSGVIDLKNYEHLTIILALGVTAAVPASVKVESSDNGSPETTAFIGFNVHKCETAYTAANGDVLGARVAAAAASGFAPSGTDNIFYVIEIDTATVGAQYVRLVLADPSGSCLASAVAILSGARYGHDQSETVLT